MERKNQNRPVRQNALNPDYHPRQQNALDPNYRPEQSGVPETESSTAAEKTGGGSKKPFPLWLLLILLALTFALGVFASRFIPDRQDPGQSAQTPPQSNPPSADQPSVTPVTLKVWSAPEDQLNAQSWLCRMEKRFEELHPEYDITWVNEICNEGDAATMIAADPAAAADVYMYTNDQLGALVQAGALSRLDGGFLTQVQNDVSATYVTSVTAADGNVYGFPISPNTWFMYYNKSLLSEEDVKSMEACLSRGVVAFPLTNSWYLPAFFFAAGGTLFGESGNDAAAGAQFGGQPGYDATGAILDLLYHPNFLNDDQGMYGFQGLVSGTVAAYFSGSWDYIGLYEALGENLGAAPVPTVMINGQPKQLKAYAGSKAVGVNPRSNHHKAAMEFAALLASSDSLLLRFELRNITPSVTALMNSPQISGSIVAKAEMATMAYASTLQPSIPEMGLIWGTMENFGRSLVSGEINRNNLTQKVDQLETDLNP